jgi:cobalt-zinc-cadmium efflux system membrane fusion protein
MQPTLPIIHKPVLALALTAVLALAGCDRKPMDPKSYLADKKFCLSDSFRAIIGLDTVKVLPLMAEVKLTGRITFDEDRVVRIFPPVAGVVKDVTVSMGDYVEKGRVLALVKSTDIAGYTAQLLTAEANLNIAQKTLQTTEDMYKSGIASERDLGNAKENYRIAAAEVARIRQVVAIFGDSKQEEYAVRAPISGFVVEKHLTEGMILRPDNTDNAFTISDLQDVWVLANVFESDIRHVREGEPVEIVTLAYPDKPMRSTVQRVSSVLDPVSKVNRVRIVLNNHGYLLKPDMFATVTVQYASGTEQRPVIPADAMVFDENKYFVLTYKDNCNINVVPIERHSTIGRNVYLNTPLAAGTAIIGKRQLLVYNALNATR